MGVGINSDGQYHAYLLTVGGITTPANLQAQQSGVSGTVIDLTWYYAGSPVDSFEIHRQLPTVTGGDHVIAVPANVCSGTNCSYVDNDSLTPFATYQYRVRAVVGGAFSDYSLASTAYQIKTYTANDAGTGLHSQIFSNSTPDPNATSIHDVALLLGFHHFNWLQTVTNEPTCDPLHSCEPEWRLTDPRACVDHATS